MKPPIVLVAQQRERGADLILPQPSEAAAEHYSPSLTEQSVIVASRLAWLPAAGFCVSTVQLRSHIGQRRDRARQTRR